MAIIKCMLCGEEIEVNYSQITWKWGCDICAGLSLCKVHHISDDEWTQMLKRVEHGLKAPNNSEQAILYSLHDPMVTQQEIIRTLPLLCIIFDKVILDGAIEVYFSDNVSNAIYNLIEENIIIPTELKPYNMDINYSIDSIDIPWKERADLIYSPFNENSFETYKILENMSLALTTSEIERIYNWAEYQPPGTLGRTLERLGYYPMPDTLWLNFTEINYSNLIAAQINSQLILNESRSSLFRLKYGNFSPQQRKLDALVYLMKRKRIMLPEFSSRNIIKLRNSKEVEQLQTILNSIVSKHDDFTLDCENIVDEYDTAVESYNAIVKKYGATGSVILSGILVTIGGLAGGPFGAVLGGIGGAASSLGIESFIEKHYAKRKVQWPFIFVK